jgi:ParB/RepB/Spo0J family partition protein
MQLTTVPLSDICCDDAFNCRGLITPFDVAELAKQIQSIGLQIPISLHKGSWKDKPDEPIPNGKGYRIIAGHRRFTAYCVLFRTDPNKFSEIPAVVKTDLDEISARVLNLSENLDRKELNIVQEAKAIKALFEAGVPRERVATMINKTGSWVQTRFNLLSLPEDIQDEAAAGMLTHLQIKQLYSLDTDDERYAAVRKIKEAKFRGVKLGHIGKKRKKPTNTKKVRQPDECFDMIELIAKSNIGYGIVTRTLAWAAGGITTEEYFKDVAEADAAFRPPSEF